VFLATGVYLVTSQTRCLRFLDCLRSFAHKPEKVTWVSYFCHIQLFSMLSSSSTRVLRSIFVQNYLTRSVHVEAKIAALGLELPAPAVPKGNFVNFLVVGNMAYLSGHLPQVPLLRCNFMYA
jgi:hypothetical protein